MVSRRTAASGGTALKALLVLAALVASVALVAFVVRPGGGDGERPDGTSSPTAPPSSGPGLSLQPFPAAPAVLAAAADTAPVSAGRLKAHLADLLSLHGVGNRLAFAVGQLGQPAVHWSYGAKTAVPASTLKLLTTSAALSVLGPDHRFTTTVVHGTTRRSVVLVGGGDPLLTARRPTDQDSAETFPQSASLEDLARATAAKLVAAGVPRVRLGYDASLFSGPAVNPHWPSTYLPDNVVSPITALWVDEGRDAPGLAERSPDPARAAAEAFRRELSTAGLQVVGDVQEQHPPRAASAIAEVRSAPLVQIVQHILEQSDNEAAEVLLRQVAVARGRPGSSAAGVLALRATLTGLGLDLRGARLYDGSGLSRDDVVPASVLLDVLRTAAAPEHPALRGVLTGLPVAGFSGTVGYRFDDHAAAAGRGYVRAKTGTLTGVDGLAGLAITRSGQVLLFVAIADRVPVLEAVDARADLDRIAAALTTCGC
jgi:serine-type D-Ala-D-Ala carboxypeptidase/endopeptidase (penicillin-binding protein 4)